jgi:hypothetical protein
LRRRSPSDTRTFLVLESGLAWGRCRILHLNFSEQPLHAVRCIRARRRAGAATPRPLRVAQRRHGTKHEVAGACARWLLLRRTSMRRHCLSRPTWRPPRDRGQRLLVLRYASIRTPGEPTLFGDSVHCEIHLFGLLKALQSSQRSLFAPRGGRTKFAIAQSPCARDPKRSDRKSHKSRSRIAASGSSPPAVL